MASKNEALLKRLLATFRVEADEHLQALAAGLLALEKAPAGSEAGRIVETIFREAHSLKGAARAVDLASVESLCQALESVFAALQQGRQPVSPALLDLLHQALDMLDALLRGPEPAAVPAALPGLIRRLEAAAAGSALSGGAEPSFEAVAPRVAQEIAAPQPAAAPITAVDTVRIAAAKLDTVMRQAEELLGPRLAAQQRVEALCETVDLVHARKKQRAQLLTALRRIERVSGNGSPQERKDLQQLLRHLEGEALFMATLDTRLSKLQQAAASDQRTLASMSEGLLESIKQMQLMPIASLLDILPRMARELARDQGKEVMLSLRGGEIELDRRVLDELKDPLIHLLRNAIDHGIESPQARRTAGKPAQGRLTLEVSQPDGGKVELRLADDGAGIDVARVKAVACQRGLLSAEAAEQLDERAALALVLRSGLSTSPIITDVSGRGLGLAIVQEKVERLGGRIAIDTQRGAGTVFRMALPLTLATLRGVLVRVADRLCAVPAVGVERVARVAGTEVRTVENRATIVLEGQVLPLVDLAEVLALARPAAGAAAVPWPVLVLGQGAARVAFRVDAIQGEQEILLKPLGPQLARVRHVAGASLLGTGEVVPVLNVADLLSSAAACGAPSAGAAAPVVRRSVLVVEDSVTSRALLKNILESVGYLVSTAVDGLEALAELKAADFDLVVSDVEMPRMDGFELTACIRADRQLAELPVVLVTALDSREHRERGVDVGASAYIVKSRFDQGNLLETVGRLL